jgi:hypothetical protein
LPPASIDTSTTTNTSCTTITITARSTTRSTVSSSAIVEASYRWCCVLWAMPTRRCDSTSALVGVGKRSSRQPPLRTINHQIQTQTQRPQHHRLWCCYWCYCYFMVAVLFVFASAGGI